MFSLTFRKRRKEGVREGGRKKEGEKGETSIGGLQGAAPTWDQTCNLGLYLTGNQTGDLLVDGTTLQPIEPCTQDYFFKNIFA